MSPLLIAGGALLLLLMVMVARGPRRTRPAPKRATRTEATGTADGSSVVLTGDASGRHVGSADSDCASDSDGSAGDGAGGNCDGGGGDGGGGDGGGD